MAQRWAAVGAGLVLAGLWGCSATAPPAAPPGPEALGVEAGLVPPEGCLLTNDCPARPAGPCTSQRPEQVCSADCFCWEAPLPQGNALTGVWAASPTEAWAAAGPYLLRWDGTAWRREEGVEGDFRAVWGTSARDVWAVGRDGSVARWDGVAWTRVDGGGGAWLVSVWGSGPENVWAAGDVLLRWDGQGLSQVFGPHPLVDVRDVWTSGPTDVWVGGADGLLQQWDGTRWTSRRLPTGGGEPRTVLDVWGSGPEDVWASADGLWHWNGEGWTRAQTGSTASGWHLWGSGAQDVWAVGTGGEAVHFNGTAWTPTPTGTTRALRAVAGASGTDVWAVGEGGVVRRWDGAQWTRTVVDPRLTLRSVWGSGPEDVWLVGSEEGPGTQASLLLHWDGSAFTRVPAPGSALLDVWGSGPQDVWAVGAPPSVVLHFDGTAWQERPLPEGTLPSLTSVWGSGPSDVWVGGVGSSEAVPSLLRWDGAGWRAEEASRTQAWAVSRLWGSGPQDVWAAGPSGVLHWDGRAWTSLFSASGSLQVWGSGPADVWISGLQPPRGEPPLLHWDGARWHAVRPGAASGLDALGGVAGEVWGFTREGVLRYRP